MSTKLFYFHDPMCSWCWGFEPTWSELQQQLKLEFGSELEILYVLGGLAPDSGAPMPQKLQDTLQHYWHRIHKLLGTTFNFDFWTLCNPRRSTYPACRAVIAASNQGKEKQMIDALQRAYYLRALNPSDISTHTHLAEELGLDLEVFNRDIKSSETEEELHKQINLYKELSGNGFPSLTLQHNGILTKIPIDYKNTDAMLNWIRQRVAPSSQGKTYG